MYIDDVYPSSIINGYLSDFVLSFITYYKINAMSPNLHKYLLNFL